MVSMLRRIHYQRKTGYGSFILILLVRSILHSTVSSHTGKDFQTYTDTATVLSEICPLL